MDNQPVPQPPKQPNIQVPQPPVQPTPIQQQTGHIPIQPQTNSGKNKTLFIILGIVGAIIVTALIVVLIVFSGGNAAQKVSDSFMDAATHGDVNALLQLPGADESDRDFLKNVADNFTGNYELIDKGEKDGKHYFLYSLSDAKSNYARLTVEEKGDWIVTDIVYGDKKLALVPGKVQDDPTTTDVTQPTNTPSSKPTIACLTQSDYRFMNYDKSVPTVNYVSADEYGYRAIRQDTMFFEPDSIVEHSLPSIYDDWAEFAKNNLDKNWQFRLEGGVYDPDGNLDPASKALAEQRSAEVKRELESRGVPASKIIDKGAVDQSAAYSNGYDSIYRNVSIFIDNPCNVDGYTPDSSSTGL